jgi:hypothetical protein
MTEDPDVPSPDDRSNAGGSTPSASASPSSSARAGVDLSREIEQAVERNVGDEVRCTRVGGDTYRCNWWSVASKGSYDNPGMKGGQLATDHRIRKSRFLRVSKGRKGLNIVEVPSG